MAQILSETSFKYDDIFNNNITYTANIETHIFLGVPEYLELKAYDELLKNNFELTKTYYLNLQIAPINVEKTVKNAHLTLPFNNSTLVFIFPFCPISFLNPKKL